MYKVLGWALPPFPLGPNNPQRSFSYRWVKGVCSGLTYVSSAPNSYAEVPSLSPSEWDLSWKYVVADIISSVSMRSYWTRLGPLIQYDWFPYKETKIWTPTHTQGEGCMKMKSEMLQQVKEQPGLSANHQKLEERNRLFLLTLRRNQPSPHLDLGICSVLLWDKNFVMFKPPTVGYFVTVAPAHWYRIVLPSFPLMDSMYNSPFIIWPVRANSFKAKTPVIERKHTGQSGWRGRPANRASCTNEASSVMWIKKAVRAASRLTKHFHTLPPHVLAAVSAPVWKGSITEWAANLNSPSPCSPDFLANRTRNK